MSMRFIVVLLLLIFLVEGTIIPWLIPSTLSGRMIPQFTFVMIIYAGLYASRHYALVLGFCFGLLQDIVYYGHLIGVHAFIMGLIGYTVGMVLERKRSTLFMALSIIGFAYLFYEVIVYSIYRIFKVTNESISWAMYFHILPSLFLQLGFALIIYVPARRWYTNIYKVRAAKDKE